MTCDRECVIHEIRKICEAVYHDFLKVYIRGLQAYWGVSVETSNQEGKARDSTRRWHNAIERALEVQKNAGNMLEDGQVELSIAMALSAAEKLEKRYFSSASHSFADGWSSVTEVSSKREHEIFGSITMDDAASKSPGN